MAEKIGLTSMGELNSRLEALDADNFGLTDEMPFWYDPAEDDEKPSTSQQIKSIKQIYFGRCRMTLNQFKRISADDCRFAVANVSFD